ncbi:MAG TPA: hypothetical protein VFB41_09635 [Solirubrobacteraceae bacterium]|nr:hypothetical protein [Solirubrobacteraceae bacterium]
MSKLSEIAFWTWGAIGVGILLAGALGGDLTAVIVGGVVAVFAFSVAWHFGRRSKGF